MRNRSVVTLAAALVVLAGCAGDGVPPPPTPTATASVTHTASPTITNTEGPTSTGTRPSTFTPTVSPTTTISPTPSPTESPSGPSLDEVQQRIFNPNCLSAGCHNASDQAGEMALEEGHSYDNLVGVEPFHPNASGLRVDPGNPDNSFLLLKLTGPPRNQGDRMPLGRSPLSADDIQLVRDWILGGARR